MSLPPGAGKVAFPWEIDFPLSGGHGGGSEGPVPIVSQVTLIHNSQYVTVLYFGVAFPEPHHYLNLPDASHPLLDKTQSDHKALVWSGSCLILASWLFFLHWAVCPQIIWTTVVLYVYHVTWYISVYPGDTIFLRLACLTRIIHKVWVAIFPLGILPLCLCAPFFKTACVGIQKCLLTWTCLDIFT